MIYLQLFAMAGRLCGRLGLVHHPTKAHPEPNHRLSHLELEIDLTDIRFSAPPEKL